MKSHRKEVWFNTSRRRELINITPVVEQEIRKSWIVRLSVDFQSVAWSSFLYDLPTHQQV